MRPDYEPPFWLIAATLMTDLGWTLKDVMETPMEVITWIFSYKAARAEAEAKLAKRAELEAKFKRVQS